MSSAVVDTIIIFTPDPAALATFYRSVLGVNPDDVVEEEGHVGFELGDLYLGFDATDGSHRHPGAVTFWVRVDDLDEAFRRSLELGATPVIEPVDRPWGDRLAAVRDPEGNQVGFSLRRSD